MKTPKRTAGLVPLNPEDWPFDPPHHAGNLLARWKRKNRIKQLKSTLQKYKKGTMLPEFRPIRIAYRWLQKLKKPKSDAPLTSWLSYLNEIRSIRGLLNTACEDAATCFGVALEREKRKEQK